MKKRFFAILLDKAHDKQYHKHRDKDKEQELCNGGSKTRNSSKSKDGSNNSNY